jgi:hypothetical protein
MKIGTLLTEMIGYEKTIDGFVDMLCRDEVITLGCFMTAVIG